MKEADLVLSLTLPLFSGELLWERFFFGASVLLH